MPVVLQNNSYIDWLKDIPEEHWAKSKTNIGCMKGAAPVVAIPKSIHKAQYPLSKEAKKGIIPLHSVLVERGTLVPSPNSPCNTGSVCLRFVGLLKIFKDRLDTI
jgi:hypothetical protein